MKTLLLSAFMLLSAAPWATAQNDESMKDKEGRPVVVEMRSVVIYGKMTDAQREAYMQRLRDYEKLRRNVQLVYPLAKACAKVIDDVNNDLKGVEDPHTRKKYMRKLEKELFEKYEDRLKGLTITQGKLLIKLIDRQCESNAYALIDEYKSWRSAAFWQLIAQVFGADLKDSYDREKEQVIEEIIRQIDSGQINQFSVSP